MELVNYWIQSILRPLISLWIQIDLSNFKFLLNFVEFDHFCLAKWITEQFVILHLFVNLYIYLRTILLNQFIIYLCSLNFDRIALAIKLTTKGVIWNFTWFVNINTKQNVVNQFWSIEVVDIFVTWLVIVVVFINKFDRTSYCQTNYYSLFDHLQYLVSLYFECNEMRHEITPLKPPQIQLIVLILFQLILLFSLWFHQLV